MVLVLLRQQKRMTERSVADGTFQLLRREHLSLQQWRKDAFSKGMLSQAEGLRPAERISYEHATRRYRIGRVSGVGNKTVPHMRAERRQGCGDLGGEYKFEPVMYAVDAKKSAREPTYFYRGTPASFIC